jgi:quinol monooxygenase YgiN
MYLAILDLHVAADDRAAAIAQLERERPLARAMPGCLDFRVLASPSEGRELTVLHEWVDAESFGTYLRSDAFARSGQVLRPLLTAPLVSRRFRAELVETVA